MKTRCQREDLDHCQATAASDEVMQVSVKHETNMNSKGVA